MDAHDRSGPAGSVLVTDEQELPVDHERLRRLAGHVLSECGVPTDRVLSVALVPADVMAALHRDHLGEHTPTDVLAFPMDGLDAVAAAVPAVLGDVVVCPEVAAAQAARRGGATADEVDLLLVHGILHLLGHDHAEADDRAVMFGRTDALLVSFRAAAAVAGPKGQR